MLTEEQAKKLWCPAARLIGRLSWVEPAPQYGENAGISQNSVGTQNRGYQMDGPLDKARCIASDCMWWRWGPEREFLNSRGDPDSELRGLCGIAGRPE